MAKRVATDQEKQTQVDKMQVLQKEYSNLISSKSKLASQANENDLVLKELLLNPINTFKLTGPVLLKIDTQEAIANVRKRLAFINGEIARLDVNIKDQDAKVEAQKAMLIRMQDQPE